MSDRNPFSSAKAASARWALPASESAFSAVFAAVDLSVAAGAVERDGALRNQRDNKDMVDLHISGANFAFYRRGRIRFIWRRAGVAARARFVAAPGRHFNQGMTRDRPIRTVSGCPARSEEHTSELQSLMRISYAVFCLKKKIRH